MVPARDVQRLTGLSADQLREWAHRRGLVRPDVAPGGPGRPALYGWQSVLILRLAVVLRERFRIELHAHVDLLIALRELLVGISFPALRGCVLALRGMEDGELLLETAVFVDREGRDTLILRLDPHLDVLATEFAPLDQGGQLPLFRVVRVR